MQFKKLLVEFQLELWFLWIFIDFFIDFQI